MASWPTVRIQLFVSLGQPGGGPFPLAIKQVAGSRLRRTKRQSQQLGANKGDDLSKYPLHRLSVAATSKSEKRPWFSRVEHQSACGIRCAYFCQSGSGFVACRRRTADLSASTPAANSVFFMPSKSASDHHQGAPLLCSSRNSRINRTAVSHRHGSAAYTHVKQHRRVENLC
jgi:hypothetical protein